MDGGKICRLISNKTEIANKMWLNSMWSRLLAEVFSLLWLVLCICTCSMHTHTHAHVYKRSHFAFLSFTTEWIHAHTQITLPPFSLICTCHLCAILLFLWLISVSRREKYMYSTCGVRCVCLYVCLYKVQWMFLWLVCKRSMEHIHLNGQWQYQSTEKWLSHLFWTINTLPQWIARTFFCVYRIVHHIVFVVLLFA